MENAFLARPHHFISSGNKWPKEIMFFSTAQNPTNSEFPIIVQHKQQLWWWWGTHRTCNRTLCHIPAWAQRKLTAHRIYKTQVEATKVYK